MDQAIMIKTESAHIRTKVQELSIPFLVNSTHALITGGTASGNPRSSAIIADIRDGSETPVPDMSHIRSVGFCSKPSRDLAQKENWQ